MQQLHLVGFTTDLEGLILSPRRGAKSGGYFVRLDDSLRASIEDAQRLRDGGDDMQPGEPGGSDDARAVTRPAQPRPASELSPREIQARLRAGSSIEEVAAEAGVDDDWVLRFADPILAEQARVVEQAQRLTLARPRGVPSAQPLGTAVQLKLAERGLVLPEDVFQAGWSAFNLHGSRWAVRFTFSWKGRRKRAEWEVDLRQGELTARNRVATELGHVEPGRRRRPPPAAEPSGRTGGRPAGAVRRANTSRAPRRPVPKATAKRATAKKATAKKVTAKKATAKLAFKKATSKRATAKRATSKKVAGKVAARKTTAKTAVPPKATAQKVTPPGSAMISRKEVARKAAARRAAPSNAAATSAPATKVPAARAAGKVTTSAKATPKKVAVGTATAKKAPAKKEPAKIAPAKKAPAKVAAAQKAAAQRVVAAAVTTPAKKLTAEKAPAKKAAAPLPPAGEAPAPEAPMFGGMFPEQDQGLTASPTGVQAPVAAALTDQAEWDAAASELLEPGESSPPGRSSEAGLPLPSGGEEEAASATRSSPTGAAPPPAQRQPPAPEAAVRKQASEAATPAKAEERPAVVILSPPEATARRAQLEQETTPPGRGRGLRQPRRLANRTRKAAATRRGSEAHEGVWGGPGSGEPPPPVRIRADLAGVPERPADQSQPQEPPRPDRRP